MRGITATFQTSLTNTKINLTLPCVFRLDENLTTSSVAKTIPKNKVGYCHAQFVTGISHRYTKYGSQASPSGGGSQSTGAVL